MFNKEFNGVFRIAVVLGCCVFAKSANGQLVDFSYSSNIAAATGVQSDTGFADTPNPLEDLLGQMLSVDVSFDSNLPNQIPAALSPNRSFFQGVDVDVSIAGDLVFDGTGSISIVNNATGGSDSFRVTLNDGTLTDPSNQFGSFNNNIDFDLLLVDDTGAGITGVGLPTSQLDLSNFTVALAGLQFNNGLGTDGGTLVADLNAPAAATALTIGQQRSLAATFLGGATAVPEPSCLMPLALLFGTQLLRRRKRA